MKLTFHGAAGEVTGSACLLETSEARVLVDFGLFQGVENKHERNELCPGVSPASLNAVLVTHAHLDHTGRLPLLGRHGYRGPIYCTPATAELTGIILRDSAKVQAQDLERLNRKRERAGEEPAQPLYTLEDVERTLSLLREVPYDAPVGVAPGMTARFVEAGHLLGSASIQICVEHNAGAHCVAFSGDLGPRGAPILKDAVGFERTDVAVMESTYGDRDHKPLAETVAEFEGIVREAVARKGRILVPSFAVGRTQLLLYLLALMFRQGTVPRFPIFVDSPMAVEASRVYLRHLELYDDEFQQLQRERPLIEDLASVKATATAEESKALNDQPGPCLIMAGAGMCTAGRILHHLKQGLWRPETSVIIVGYQGEGSLGRQLVEGAKQVSIFGEKIAVRARVHTLGGFSAHAGQSDLLRWVDQMAHCRPRLLLNHGEPKAREALARLIEQRHGLKAAKPMQGQTFEF